jgi:hypothetical protein
MCQSHSTMIRNEHRRMLRSRINQHVNNKGSNSLKSSNILYVTLTPGTYTMSVSFIASSLSVQVFLFILLLFKFVNNPDGLDKYWMANWRILRNKLSWPILKHCPSICNEKLGKKLKPLIMITSKLGKFQVLTAVSKKMAVFWWCWTVQTGRSLPTFQIPCCHHHHHQDSEDNASDW